MSEMQIGRMMKEIPKATPNNNPFHENVPQDKLVKAKSETIRDLGFTPKQTAQKQIDSGVDLINPKSEPEKGKITAIMTERGKNEH